MPASAATSSSTRRRHARSRPEEHAHHHARSALGIEHLHLGVVRLGDFTHDRQAQARPFGARLRGAVEALEDAFENNSPEVHSYLQLETGEVLRIERLVTEDGESLPEEEWPNVPGARVQVVKEWVYPEDEYRARTPRAAK